MEKIEFLDGKYDKWDPPPPQRAAEGVRVETRQTLREMVRSMQGIFCKGRYRSWSFFLAGRGDFPAEHGRNRVLEVVSLEPQRQSPRPRRFHARRQKTAQA
jgi:hypothetical protein